MNGPLYRPDPERLATSNAWAFLHWCRPDGVPPTWPGLLRWSAISPKAFGDSVKHFAAFGGTTGTNDTGALARTLLHADLRPDDKVLVTCPWAHARPEGTIFIDVAGSAALVDIAAHRATVLVAEAASLGALTFRHPAARPNLSCLRTVLAVGSPLAPETRARLYVWLKPDVLLLAQAGELLWGSPLDPVPLEPDPPARFFRA